MVHISLVHGVSRHSWLRLSFSVSLSHRRTMPFTLAKTYFSSTWSFTSFLAAFSPSQLMLAFLLSSFFMLSPCIMYACMCAISKLYGLDHLNRTEIFIIMQHVFACISLCTLHLIKQISFIVIDIRFYVDQILFVTF